MKVKLEDVIDAVDSTDDDIYFLYNPESGEVYLFSEYDSVSSDEDINEDEVESFIALPSKYDIDDYQIMVNFIDSVPNAAQQDQLNNSIHGRGAFRFFRSTVEQLDLLQLWYSFRDNAYREIAISWCRENGIDYEE